MDEGELEIDVDICEDDGDHAIDRFPENDSEQAFVHDLEKYGDLDPFLTQGDIRNVLDFGYDPFPSDRCLADHSHILESTLDSILCVNEEEEVVGQAPIESDLIIDQQKSESQTKEENKNKNVKKYNMRQKRKPAGCEMFVYESPSAAVPSSDKARKRQDKASVKKKIGLRSKAENDDDDDNKNKTFESESSVDIDETSQKPSSQPLTEKRLTRRQSRLTGIKPTANLKVDANKGKGKKSDKSGDSESCNEDSCDDGTTTESIKVPDKSKQDRSSLPEKRGRGRPRKQHQMETKCDDEEFESYHSEDYEVADDDDSDADYIVKGNETDDKSVNKSNPDKKTDFKRESDNISVRKPSKELKATNMKMYNSENRWHINRKDDELAGEGTDSDKDVYNPGVTELKNKPKPTEKEEKPIVKEVEKPKMALQGPSLSLWEKMETEAVKLENEGSKNKSPIKDEKQAEIISKENKLSNAPERKLKEPLTGKRQEVDKDSIKESSADNNPTIDTNKSRTISLASFVHSTTKKGGRGCRGPGCEVTLPPLQKSIYCSQACIDKYSQYALLVLNRERSKFGQSAGDHSNDRVVVLERQTGKILTGPTAPTEVTLSAWIARHPSFEVMLNSQFSSLDRKERKVVEKKLLPASLRDNPSLTKDIKMLAAKYLAKNKELEDSNKTSTSTAAVSSVNVGSQSKRPDPTRISVRNVLREMLTNRANGCDDVMVSSNEIKSLVMDIEDELFTACDGVTSKYKYKFKAIITQIKDPSNKGFFRRCLFGELQPQQLIKMTNEKIASRELASWNDEVSALAILASPESTFPMSFTENTKLSPPLPLFDALSLATSETTSQHGTHFFDMNCKICTGKVPEPSYNLHSSSRPEIAPSYSSKNQFFEATWEKNKSPSYMFSSSQQHDQKPPLKAPLLPTPIFPSTQNLSNTNPVTEFNVIPVKVTKVMTSYDIDEVLWTGTIFAKDITSVKIDTYLVSGSLSSSTPGVLKSLIAEDLPDIVHMAGRLPPDNVFSFLSQLKLSGRLSKDVAIVYFQPANNSEEVFYNNLFSYLNNRNRCGVVTSGSKGGVGRVKDLYIMPLPPNTMPPSILLPFDGPGLPVNRGNLLLGIVIKYGSKISSSSSSTKLATNVGKSDSDISIVSPTIYNSSQAPPDDKQIDNADDPDRGGADDDEMLEENKVIFNSAKTDKVQVSKPVKGIPQKYSNKLQTAADPDDEPYEPFDSSTLLTDASQTNQPITKVLEKVSAVSSSNDTILSMAHNKDTSGSSSIGSSLLTNDNIAATMLSTLSAVTASTSLEDQQRMLQELTQKINEQKKFLLQQEESLKKAIDSSVMSIIMTPADIPENLNKPLNQTSSFLLDSSVSTAFKTSSSLSTNKSDAKDIKTNLTTDIPSFAAKLNPQETKNKMSFDDKINPDLRARDISKIKVDGTVACSSNVTNSQTNPSLLPANILSSLPAAIDQLLSGETLKNLKNIVANMSNNKLPSTSSKLEVKSCLSQQESKISLLHDLPQSSPIVSDVACSKTKNTFICVDKSIKNANIHGDFDYRPETHVSLNNPLPPQDLPLKTTLAFHGLPLITSSSISCENKPQNTKISSSNTCSSRSEYPSRKPALLATPLMSIVPVSQFSQGAKNSSTNNVSTVKDSKDKGIWKPLLSKNSRSNEVSKSSSRESSSSLRRKDWRNRSRSRSKDHQRKRKHSPNVDLGSESKRRNGRDNVNSLDLGTSVPESQDGGSDDVQFVKEEKAVIEIDEEEEEGEVNDGDNKRKSKNDHASSIVRNLTERPRNRSRERSKSREKPKSRERSRSREKRRHQRRLRSRNEEQAKSLQDNDERWIPNRNIRSRKSKSRSPLRRTTSKINPLYLPHNLPTIFPSLMQIVAGGSTQKMSEPDLISTGNATVNAIPSLLDMLDPTLLPAKYKKSDNNGLSGKYTEDKCKESSGKKGLLGDFPLQSNNERRISECSLKHTIPPTEEADTQLSASINKNLAVLRKESQKLSPNVDRKSNISNRNNFHKSSGPESAFHARSNLGNDEKNNLTEKLHQERDKSLTLLPTPKLNEPPRNGLLPFPTTQDYQKQQRREGKLLPCIEPFMAFENSNTGCPHQPLAQKGFPIFNRGIPRPSRLPLPLTMPRSILNVPDDIHPFLRLPGPMSMRPPIQYPGFHRDGQRFVRPPFNAPQRFPNR